MISCEIEDPCKGKRYPVRWYETKVSDDWEQEIPIEWEAWLRGRRTSPPVMENLFQYMKIMKKIQVNSLKKYPEIKVNTFISLLISCTCPILVGKSKSVLLLDFQLLNLVPASNNLCLIIEECFQ
ncbi:uncharacterized protein LOC143244886 isoform X4 [Tachypleus tridentatus]|uniref:uncharacterized protein LOC143244886 isoform X4 n=1 Tax=Tachypleus tridentatus TaxID=6853 RepID=UPI003FD4475F